MAEVVIMPKLGFNMDEGQLVKWCKRVGDTVAKGEVLFEINTDKTTMPVESTTNGILLKVMLDEGAFAEVFTPIAVVGQAGEDPDAFLAVSGGAAVVPDSTPQTAAPASVAAAVPVAVATGDLKLTPKARKLVRAEGIDPASLALVQGSGFRGGITAKDIKASPLARKIAERDGIDLAGVQGSGAGGKVMKADLGATSQPVSAGSDEKKIRSVTPYKGVRKVIGERLAQSKAEAPHVYFTASVDMTQLTAFRAQIAASGEKVAVSDLLVLAASKTLQKYPEVNVSLMDDSVVCYQSTNIGVAVAGDNGLVVPVVKNVQEKTLSGVATETRDLVERAKTGRLDPSEYTGGTFTISNLGPFGIENFTAIVNPPEAAILAVSAVRKVPVVETDEQGCDSVVIRPMMHIQLSVDHRVIDGLLAAKFVQYFKGLLEAPVRILL